MHVCVWAVHVRRLMLWSNAMCLCVSMDSVKRSSSICCAFLLLTLCVCVCACACVSVCACVCACVRACVFLYLGTYTHTCADVPCLPLCKCAHTLLFNGWFPCPHPCSVQRRALPDKLVFTHIVQRRGVTLGKHQVGLRVRLCVRVLVCVCVREKVLMFPAYTVAVNLHYIPIHTQTGTHMHTHTCTHTRTHTHIHTYMHTQVCRTSVAKSTSEQAQSLRSMAANELVAVSSQVRTADVRNLFESVLGTAARVHFRQGVLQAQKFCLRPAAQALD